MYILYYCISGECEWNLGECRELATNGCRCKAV